MFLINAPNHFLYQNKWALHWPYSISVSVERAIHLFRKTASKVQSQSRPLVKSAVLSKENQPKIDRSDVF